MGDRSTSALKSSIPSLLAISLAVGVILLFVSPAVTSLGHGSYLGTIELRPLLWWVLGCWLLSGLLALAPSATAARATAATAVAATLAIATAAVWQSRRGREVIAALFVLAAALAIGSVVLRVLRQPEELSPLERFSLAVALGLGLLSHLSLLLSVAGILYAPVVVAVMGVLIASGVKTALRLSSPLYRSGRAFLLSPPRHELFFLTAVLIVLLTCFIEGLAPPIQYDDLNYHLLIPFRHASAHQFVILPDVIQAYFYQGTEMLSTLGFLLGGESSAILLNLAAGVLAGAGLAGLCIRLFSRRAGWLAVVFWMGTPLAVWLMTNGYVEMDLALFCLFSFVATLSFVRGRHGRSAFVAGLLGAFAMSTKMNGAVFAVLVLAVAMAGLLLARNVRDCLRLGGWWAAGFVLAGWPWPVLRFVQTGNPTYPFLNGVFKAPGVGWSNMPFNLSHFGMGTGLTAFLQAPWNLSVHGGRFAEGIHPSVVGPCLLLAIVFACFAARSVPLEARYALAVSGLFFCFWFLTGQFSRYLMPTVPLIVLVCATGFARALEKFHSTTQLALTLGLSFLVLSSSYVIWMASYYNIPERVPLRVVFGAESRTAYLHQVLPVTLAYDSIRETCDSSKETVFGAANQFGYLCPSLVAWTSQRADFIWKKGTDEFYREGMRGLGVTHVLMDGSAGGVPGVPMVDSGFLKRAGEVTYAEGAFSVIKLK